MLAAEIPHTLDAIKISQHTANVFVDTARYSAHKPESHEEELNMVIYGTPPVFSARDEVEAEDNYDGPDMTYYFDKPEDNPDVGPDDGGGDVSVPPPPVSAVSPDRAEYHKYKEALKRVRMKANAN